MEKARAQRAEQAVAGEEPLHQITMRPPAEDEDAWLDAKVRVHHPREGMGPPEAHQRLNR